MQSIITPSETDPYNLERFVSAQDPVYDSVLEELRAGQKTSHWIWFIFPQIAGIGYSPTSKLYAIKDLDEAKAYFTHPILRQRYLECLEIMLLSAVTDAFEYLSPIDAKKLRSSLSLFLQVDPKNEFLLGVLKKYFNDSVDKNTLKLLERG